MPNVINKVVFGSQTLIDLSQDTVTADDVINSKYFHTKNGERIQGTCTYDADTTTDNAPNASEILTGKEAWANGSKVEGSMPNRGAVSGTISALSTPYSVQAGYHDGSGTVGIDSTEAAKIIASNIKSGVSILGITGDYAGEAISAGAGSGTPAVTSQTILPSSISKDYFSQFTIAAIPYSETATTGTTGYTATIG